MAAVHMPQSEPASPPIIATYRLQCDPGQADAVARFIAFEQTVELPERLVTDATLLREIVGEVRDLRADGPGHAIARIAFNAELASGQLSQLLNLLYGNVSMASGIRLVDVDLPDTLLQRFNGPRHGIDGVRALLGVYDRPLLATAVKPRGLSDETLAHLVGRFALGGGDIVKDDQNLVAPDFEGFKRRVDACAKAVNAANAQTGRQCLYFPHLAAPDEELDDYAGFVLELGLHGVLVCPMVIGLDRMRYLNERYGLVCMAHPAMSGVYTQSRDHGIAHDVLLGTLFRLAGADISVFPAPGGRFPYSAEECAGLASALTRPLGQLAPAWPCPAGGMRFESLPQLEQDYGVDAVLLIGGSLLGHAPDLADGTRAYQTQIRAAFPERLVEPQTSWATSCEFEPSTGEGVHTLLSFLQDFRWQHRSDLRYKNEEDDFNAVRRVELIGRHGEQADFDLRYFEVEPGGYTSLEKHLHTHVILVARGQGVLVTDELRADLKPMDVAYVRPLEVHQLRNESEQPFGFFCIVDRERDRPMRP
ncbi:MAG: cupin domain-containing protein [Xanthomonadales bacterium]|nr:cupin domain-containing protein [Xanthomonadales bacterium]